MKSANHHSFWLGAFASAIATGWIGYWLYQNAEANADDYIKIASGAAFTLLLIVLLYVVFRRQVLRANFRNLTEDSESAFQHLVRAVSHAMDKDHDAAAVAAGAAGDVVSKWVSWYFMIRWVIATAVAVLIAFAGFAGVIVLFEQNNKLQTQNSLFEIQNELSSIRMTEEFRRALQTSSIGPSGGRQAVQQISGHEFLVSVPRHWEQQTRSFNESAVLSIVRLGNREKLRPFVIEALQPLLVDDNGGVAAGAFTALTQLGVSEFGRITLRRVDDLQLELSDVTIQELGFENISGGHVSINNAKIAQINIEQTLLDKLDVVLKEPLVTIIDTSSITALTVEADDDNSTLKVDRSIIGTASIKGPYTTVTSALVGIMDVTNTRSAMENVCGDFTEGFSAGDFTSCSCANRYWLKWNTATEDLAISCN